MWQILVPISCLHTSKNVSQATCYSRLAYASEASAMGQLEVESDAQTSQDGSLDRAHVESFWHRLRDMETNNASYNSRLQLLTHCIRPQVATYIPVTI